MYVSIKFPLHVSCLKLTTRPPSWFYLSWYLMSPDFTSGLYQLGLRVWRNIGDFWTKNDDSAPFHRDHFLRFKFRHWIIITPLQIQIALSHIRPCWYGQYINLTQEKVSDHQRWRYIFSLRDIDIILTWHGLQRIGRDKGSCLGRFTFLRELKVPLLLSGETSLNQKD